MTLAKKPDYCYNNRALNIFPIFRVKLDKGLREAAPPRTSY